MARFRCRACGSEGTFAYSGTHECPNCGSDTVQFTLSIEELGDEPLIVALTKMAENDTKD
jgi:rubredoxin